MNSAMRLRGPDDEGVAFFHGSEPKFANFSGDDTPEEVFRLNIPHAPQSQAPIEPPLESVLALGHRRLSILDLSPAGHQPMCTEDGRLWIVYNGEVYNHRELRAELVGQGERFFSRTDTEVVLKAYRRWGPNCLDRFDGQWALAIWDNVEKRLFCSRDRMGIRPFYYLLTGELFVFASSIKALTASGLYRPVPDFEGIYQAMSFQYPLRPRTCFEGIRGLPQAHWMTIDLEGNLRTRQYWRIPLDRVDDEKSSADWEAELAESLARSVRSRLIADVPVGTYMSGGIDSTTIAAIAAKQHPNIKAMTLAFQSGIADYDKHDELPQARATARLYPMEHVVRDVGVQDVLDAVDDMAQTFEEPCYPFTANYLVARLASQCNVRVALAGLGPDELFCGYNRHYLAHRWQQIPRWGRSVARYLPAVSSATRRLRRIARLRSYAEGYVRSWALFQDEHKRKLFAPGLVLGVYCHETLQQAYDPPGHQYRDAVEATCFYDALAHIGNAHAFHEDQCGMRFSIESRFPYLDHEVVELAFRMPSRLKLHGNVRKYVVRQVAKGLIHSDSLTMPKRGFCLPTEWFLRGPLRELMAERLTVLQRRGFLRAAELQRLQQDAVWHDKSCVQLGYLLALELWFEKFIDGHTTVSPHSKRLQRAVAVVA